MNPDAKVSLFTRLWDWLTYRPWTNEQLAERVARSVTNTSYQRNWGRPVEPGTPVHPTLHHCFTGKDIDWLSEQYPKGDSPYGQEPRGLE